MIVTVHPDTGEPLERFEYFDKTLLDKRLNDAAAAATLWRRTGVEQRTDLLRALGQRLREQREPLAATAVREMGKPIVQARAEVDKCAWCCEFFASNGEAMVAAQAVETGAARSYIAFRPLGTILAIMPWNFPFWQLFRAAVPALLAGNAMLLKHAENTTRCGLEIERVFREAGAPDGLLSTLLISNERADALLSDARVAGVTLTGSERAGVAVASAAGLALKKCVLELGGSDAFVVLADADIDAAVTAAVTGRFQNNGQSCIAAKRFILVPEVREAFVEQFVQRVEALRVGDPAREDTDVGPCARADLRDTLHEQVCDTLAAGGQLLAGGEPIEGAGFFYRPTVVNGVTAGMPMFERETFGPAAAIVAARDLDDALALANATQYGLGCSIWTRDVALAEIIAQRVEAGSVFVNGIVASDPRLPFGGVKKSGYGRELSTFGVHEFANIQTVHVSPSAKG
jgi:acyl-CoA reductase-like NAD-dependent aldehyde dehydrogenase